MSGAPVPSFAGGGTLFRLEAPSSAGAVIHPLRTRFTGPGDEPRRASSLASTLRDSYTYFDMLSAADREIRLGLWKIHILHHAAVREVWGTWLLAELAEHGHDLSPGTLYPALARMEANRWLAPTRRAPHPRARRALRITAAGRRLLDALRRDVTELHREVVLGREPAARSRKRPRSGPRKKR
jgi:PadR family transcriptional regulator, regulatory protein PadR